ncbi:glycosyltransferase [Anaerolineales bacterium HSG24]|nr:glycosyltransferase [Anaerolineales bacterium HSG24]
MKPLHILFISPYLPSMIRVRPYNFLKYLAQHQHKITLVALEPSGEDQSGLVELRRWCHQVHLVTLPRWRPFWNALSALPSRTPLQAAYSRSPEMTARLKQLQQQNQFDVVHVEHLRGAELSQAINDIPVVFDSVDSITLLFERVLAAGPNLKSRFLAWLDLSRTRHYEGRLQEKFKRVLVTSPLDREALERISSNKNGDRLVVLPNGVDLDYFQPMDLERAPSTVIFTGKMSYHANIAAGLDLATKVMPLVWQDMPTAKLVIAGKDPSAELRALTSDSRIDVTGTVPDLRPYLAQATIAVTPIRYGVGIQNKVLEAMAMATPVVSSPQAVSALQLKAEEDVMVAEKPPEMAQAIIKLFNNPTRQQQIGQAGRTYVETHHDWNMAAKRLDETYRAVMNEA